MNDKKDIHFNAFHFKCTHCTMQKPFVKCIDFEVDRDILCIHISYNQTRSSLHQASKILKEISDIYAFKNLTFVSYFLKVFCFHQNSRALRAVTTLLHILLYMNYIYLGCLFLLLVVSIYVTIKVQTYIKQELVRLHFKIRSYVNQN